MTGINVPVGIDGKVICPGDIIIGDEDGIVVMKPDEAEEILEKGTSHHEERSRHDG